MSGRDTKKPVSASREGLTLGKKRGRERERERGREGEGGRRGTGRSDVGGSRGTRFSLPIFSTRPPNGPRHTRQRRPDTVDVYGVHAALLLIFGFSRGFSLDINIVHFYSYTRTA